MRLPMTMLVGALSLTGCAPPGYIYERGFTLRPRDACALTDVTAKLIGALSQKVGQPDGPTTRIVKVQQIAADGMAVEQRSQITSCRAILELESGTVETGTIKLIPSSDGLSWDAAWQSDATVAKQAADQQRAEIEARKRAEDLRMAYETRQIPIEKDAVLYQETKQFRDLTEKLARFVQDNTYACKSVSAARPMITAAGFVLTCNEFRYKYDIQDKGGRWTVTVR